MNSRTPVDRKNLLRFRRQSELERDLPDEPPRKRDSIGTRRVSGKQLVILFEYLNSHKDIAVAHNRSLHAKEHASKKWRVITEILNSQGNGAYKDWRGWSKYWVDYKAKLKKKAAYWRSSQCKNEEGHSTDQSLLDIEKKFLRILGEEFGLNQGLIGVKVEPFAEEKQADLIAQPCGSATEESPAFQIHVSDSVHSPEDSLASESSLPANIQIDPLVDPVKDSVQEAPIPADRPSPAPSAPSSTGHSKRRRRRLLTHEAARRALVQSSARRAEAAERSSQALEGIGHSLVEVKQGLLEICNTLQRIERAINDGVSRAAE